MSVDRNKDYCTIDHTNKQKELARLTPYQFWLGQVERCGATSSNRDHGEVVDPRHGYSLLQR